MSARAFGRGVATAFLTFIAVLVWFLAWMVAPFTGDDPAAAPSIGRHLPPISVGPGTQAISDPSLPYALIVPTGFAVAPFPPPGVLDLVPESWLPTQARIRVVTTTARVDTDALSMDELTTSGDLTVEGGATPAEMGVISTYATNGFRVVVSNYDHTPTSGRRSYRVFHKDTIVNIVTIPPDPAYTYDPETFPKAADALLVSLTFR